MTRRRKRARKVSPAPPTPPPPTELEARLAGLSRSLGVCVTIHDRAGLGALDARFAVREDRCLQHLAPLCLLSKSCEAGRVRCVKNKYRALRRAEETGTAWAGPCWLGLVERVQPVVADGRLVAAIFAGPFSGRAAKPEAPRLLGFSRKKIAAARRASLSKRKPDRAHVAESLELLAAMLAEAWRAAERGRLLDGEMRLAPARRASRARAASERAAAYLRRHFRERVTLEELAHEAYLSPWHLSRVFRREMGLSPFAYLRALRIEAAKRLLAESDLEVTQIAFEIGFEDSNHFSRAFRAAAGASPTDFRARKRR